MKASAIRGWHVKGENHYNWKSNPNYRTLHRWVNTNKPKSPVCENCGTSGVKLECANISGVYTRNLNDYKWLCRSCHMEEDGRFCNLKQGEEAIFKTKLQRTRGYKTCSFCKSIKPLHEFAKNKYRKSGIQSYCLECARLKCKEQWIKRKAKGLKK